MKNEEVTQELINNLQQKNLKYIVFSKLKFSKGFSKQVGFPSKPNGSTIANSIKPYLGDRLEILPKGNIRYLAFKGSRQAWVRDYIETNPGRTSKQVAQAIKPLKKSDIIKDLNALVISGSIRMELTDTHSVKLYSLKLSPPTVQPEKSTIQPPVHVILTKDDWALFKEAFEEVEHGVDRGRIAVRIFNVRRKLGWPRERFDKLLGRLRDERIIQLHGGDNTSMIKDEIADSFTDENGFLHITMTWRRIL